VPRMLEYSRIRVQGLCVFICVCRVCTCSGKDGRVFMYELHIKFSCNGKVIEELYVNSSAPAGMSEKTD
jgi:hypothetical protein